MASRPRVSKYIDFDYTINSDLFKKDTNNQTYTPEQLEELKDLHSFILSSGDKLSDRSIFSIFAKMSLGDYDGTMKERYVALKDIPNQNRALRFPVLYGPFEGKRRFDSYSNKHAVKNTFEAKQEKFGWTQEQFDEYNKGRAVTLENLIKKHGKEEGTKVYESYCEKQRYTNTLEYFQEKHGDEGEQKWLEYNRAKANTFNYLWVAKKYNLSEDDAKIWVMDFFTKLFRNKKTYKPELEMKVCKQIELTTGEKFQYSVHTSQYAIWSGDCSTKDWNVYFYDFTCTKRKKIIELNGDFYHANPAKYTATDMLRKGDRTTSAQEIWDRDAKKSQLAVDHGFEILTIWESEFSDDPDATIAKIKDWWLK